MKFLVIMPFAKQFDPVHKTIKMSVADALPSSSVESLRLDEVRSAGRITNQLIEALRGADFYIADISLQNANVMWEVGFAAAIGRPTIFISQSGDPLPIDIQDERVVRYNRRKLEATLYSPLKEAIQQTLANRRATDYTIVVTGTSATHPQRATALLLSLLDPYLGRNVAWLCGGTGTTDEVALGLLLRRGENVTPVTDGTYNLTTTARALVLQYDLSPINADLEMRDARYFTGAQVNEYSAMLDLFLKRADLLILLGPPDDGRTLKLMTGATERKRPFLVAFP